MSCCNARRSSAAQQGILRAAIIAQSRPLVSDSDRATAWLVYTGPNNLALRGPGSGAVYQMTRKGQCIAIDQRDVATLLRTNLFKTA